jgi:AcrR family transcriptional regulator
MPTVPKSPVVAERIFEAAGKLFARQGYNRTTTRQIAQLAHVGENTIFRLFDHKEALFWSTLQHYCAGLKLRRDLEDGLSRSDSPQIILPKIIALLTDLATYKPELLQMITVAFLELHWKAEQFGNQYLAPVMSQISRYLDSNIKDGKIHGSDPTILTAALTMTTLIHPGISKMINGGQTVYRNSQDASHAHAEFWLDLLSKRPIHPTLVSQKFAGHQG